MIESLIAEAYKLHRGGQREKSLSLLNQALALDGRNAHALNARGMVFDSLGRHDEALADIQAALSVLPEFPDALNNRGIHYARLRQLNEALACYDRSLALQPTQPHARYNRATALLSAGDWLRGFREFESRWEVFPFETARRNRLKPLWLGEHDVAGKTVLLHHEQGYGDTLQFCRYAVLVMRLGARALVAVPAALRTLMMTLPGRPQIVTEGEPIPEHDYCCSLMSLPHVFLTTPESVPAEVPYLRADPQAAQQWRERLGAKSRLRIGLVWSGRRYPPINYPRDMSLEALRPLLELPADFVCLQQQLWDTERDVLGAAPNVVRHGDTFNDFAATAAVIDTLDLVITVDTAVAHLAGALGKPVWLMNRYASCWRWMQDRPDSPWYPTLRLFRQRTPGDWTAVVADVHAAAVTLLQRAGSVLAAGLERTRSLESRLNAALTQHHQGHREQALAEYERILQEDPLQPQALHFQGIALAQLGRHETALKSLSLLLRLQPENSAAYNHHGNALAGLLRYEAALDSYERAIRLDPTSVDALYNRGCCFTALARYEEAALSYEAVLAVDAHHAQAHNNLGNALYDLRRFEAALEHHEAATKCNPSNADTRVNAANTLKRLGRNVEALEYVARALVCNPSCAQAHSCRGAILAAMGNDQEALKSYHRALEIKPTLAEATWNEALALLSRGDLREGWARYEARWKVKTLNLTPCCGDRAPWLGQEDLEGKVIFLAAEQGYGDSIQFCRYAPLLAARGAYVILGVPVALQRLMKTLEGVQSVVAQAPLPHFDQHCPLMSLPLSLGTQLSTIPGEVPYLRADPTGRAVWAHRLGPRSAPRVGLVWSGRSTHTQDANRSIALRELLPLIRAEVQWVSLQKEVRDTDLHALAGLPAVKRWGEELTDFADAAALLSELDLVISVDTAIAHLAGALGKPVWILLPHVADWRWLQQREDSPWYPTARLFRQKVAGDWGTVIERVTAQLRTFARDQGQGCAEASGSALGSHARTA